MSPLRDQICICQVVRQAITHWIRMLCVNVKKGKLAWMVFKGLDAYADVFLNEKLMLKANNMFREWVIDAKPELKKGKNEYQQLGVEL